jgi:two-component system, sensor histidine kinase
VALAHRSELHPQGSSSATYSFTASESRRWLLPFFEDSSRLRDLFWSPGLVLSQSQRLERDRRLLRTLGPLTGYWGVILLVASTLVLRFGARDPSPLNHFTIPVWIISLWSTVVIPYVILISNLLRLPKNPSSRTIRLLNVSWAVWIAAVMFCWLSAQWALTTERSVANGFLLNAQTFMYIAMPASVISVMLVSSNRLGVIFVSIITLGMFILLTLQHPPVNPGFKLIVIIWNTATICAYSLIGWCVSIGLGRSTGRTILLEAEQSRANLFIAAISHDLRQPLAALALKLRSMQSKAFGAEALADIRFIREQSSAIQNMVDATFDLSRLEAGEWKVSVQEVSLPLLVEKIMNDLQPEATAKGIILEARVPPYIVRSDPIALERILRNLIGNALRYTPEGLDKGSSKVSVECELAETHQLMRVTVSDNGIGIPPHRLEDIFKEYVQIGNEERDRNKGFGLGLSIVKHLIALLPQHGIEVRSSVGKGSQFTIVVPSVGKIPQEYLKAGQGKGETVDLAGTVVVVIEDDQAVREALVERLMTWGCYVIEGESAEEVMKKLRGEQLSVGPHLIISDFKLRGGEKGTLAVTKVRNAVGFDVPAGIWTAQTKPADLNEIISMGLPLLPKPPTDDALLDLLKSATITAEQVS